VVYTMDCGVTGPPSPSCESSPDDSFPHQLPSSVLPSLRTLKLPSVRTGIPGRASDIGLRVRDEARRTSTPPRRSSRGGRGGRDSGTVAVKLPLISNDLRCGRGEGRVPTGAEYPPYCTPRGTFGVPGTPPLELRSWPLHPRLPNIQASPADDSCCRGRLHYSYS